MYCVCIENGRESYEKNIFKGQMIAITDQNLVDTFLDNEQKEVNMICLSTGMCTKHFRIKK